MLTVPLKFLSVITTLLWFITVYIRMNSIHYNNVAMINNSVYTNELNILNANIITTINKLKNQNKRADIDSIQKQLVKTTSMQDLTKEDLLKKVHDLKTEEKIVNKLNRNKDSFHVSKDIVDAFSKIS